MKFTQFSRQQLLDKLVLWSTSDNMVNQQTRQILPIVYAGNEGFQIQGQPHRLFSYYNGHEQSKGREIKHGEISKCQLVSDNQADLLTEKMSVIEHKKSLIKIIIDNQDKLIQIDTRDLTTIANRIKELM